MYPTETEPSKSTDETRTPRAYNIARQLVTELRPSERQELIRRLHEAEMKDARGEQCAGGAAHGSTINRAERIDLTNIDDAMAYQGWNPDQLEAGNVVREALTAAAKAILRQVPDSPYRSVALRNVLDARMNANAAISFRGRF